MLAKQIILHPDENGAKFIFDKPFLIWLREKQAKQPYFSAWIENAELMEAAN